MTEVERNEYILLNAKKGDRKTWEEHAMEDRGFLIGLQWKNADAIELKSKNQPALPINEVKPARDQVVAVLTENPPRFHVVAREESDTKVSGDLADLFSYIWDISKGNVKIKKFIGDYIDIGMGCLQVYVDYSADWGNGEIKITDLNPLDVYIVDSKEPDASDASHILVVKYLKKEQIKEMYPDFDFEGAVAAKQEDYPMPDRYDAQGQILYEADDMDEKYECIDRYTKIKEKRFKVIEPNLEDILNEKEYREYAAEPAAIISKIGRPDQYVTESYQVEEIQKAYNELGSVFHIMVDPMTQEFVKMPGAEHDSPYVVKGSTTSITITNKAQLLNEGIIKVDFPKIDRIRRVFSIGRKLIANYVMDISNYPIVTAMLHHNRNPFPVGDIRLVKPLQEQLNKIDSLIISYNTNITNVKAFVPKGAYDKKDLKERWNKAGSELFEYDPELGGVPIVVQLTQMSSALYAQRDNLIRQIQRIMGAYSYSDGEVNTVPQTKGGTLILDEMGQRRSNAKRRDIEEALNQAARVIAEIIPKVYTKKKVIRIVEPNNSKAKESVFNEVQADEYGAEKIINDLTTAKFDVVVISGSMLPTNKMARFEVLKDAWINGMIKDPTPAIRMLDLPNLDEILEREDLIKQAEGMIQGLQEEIKELQGDLQTADRETVQARKKVEVEKFKTKLDKDVNAVNAAVLLGKQRLNDLVKQQNRKEKKR